MRILFDGREAASIRRSRIVRSRRVATEGPMYNNETHLQAISSPRACLKRRALLLLLPLLLLPLSPATLEAQLWRVFE